MADITPFQLPPSSTTATNDVVVVQSNSTGQTNSVQIGNLMPDGSFGGTKLNYASYNWYAVKGGTTNTSSPGSFAFTPLNGGLTLTVPMVNGGKYLISISSGYVSPSVATQFDIAAQLGGGTIIDLICTSGAIGLPMMGRTVYAATSTASATITCGVLTGGAATVRTDGFMVVVTRIA